MCPEVKNGADRLFLKYCLAPTKGAAGCIMFFRAASHLIEARTLAPNHAAQPGGMQLGTFHELRGCVRQVQRDGFTLNIQILGKRGAVLDEAETCFGF